MCKREQTVYFLHVVHRITTDRTSGQKTAAASSWAGLQILQPTGCSKEEILASLYLLLSFKCWNFDNNFYLDVFKAIRVNGLILVVAVLT